MNVFENINNEIFIEDESDLLYLKNVALKKGYNLGNVELYSIIYLNELTKKYIVKPYDTLKSIANKFGITEESVKQKAGTSKIFIGQQINF